MESIVSQFLRTLIDEASGASTSIRPSDVRREFRRLQSLLQLISAVVADAERRRMEDYTIKLWLKDLKEIIYDADDVMDLYAADQMPSGPAPPPPSPPMVRWFFCLNFTRVARRYEISIRIREINLRLEEIAKHRFTFKLREIKSQQRDIESHRRTSPILTSDVVGIEEDSRALIAHLLNNTHKQGNQVFAITGMGGIGKTTLAQKIYNDNRIMDHFDIRLWVVVTQSFSETDILRGILSYANFYDKGRNTDGAVPTKQELEERLSRCIADKRFFLVLDDVWGVDVWEHVLRHPLQSGAPGSRIIVTTRNEGVARQMGAAAVRIHRVRPLSVEDSRSLFCKMVFVDEEDEGEMEQLMDIGMKIVHKCGGIPLALKSLGRILRTKEPSQHEWTKVLEKLTSSRAGFEEEYMSALYLSYQALPSPLKQCFLYCSLLPENRIIARRDLMQMWISEGFVELQPRVGVPEDVAEDYYAEIVARGLLQSEPHNLKMDQGCRIHDLIRDLAINLAEDDNYTGDLSQLHNARSKVRRLSIGGREPISSPDIITSQRGLRALLIFDNPLSDNMLRALLDQLRRLRVLDLSGTEITEVPSSLGNLLHLRYLNLSHTGIRHLPNSIKDLRNLLFLNLHGCIELCSLPKSISQLHNLRSLDLLYTALDDEPSGVGEMEHLNTLLGFVVGYSSLEKLKDLNQLRYLNIRKLNRARGVGAELQNKHHLRSLVLSWTEFQGRAADHDIIDNIEVVNGNFLEEIAKDLRPPPCLEQLTVEYYPGLEYPRWMFSPTDYPNLVRLNLKNCVFCASLPPLGQLPQLKNLRISGSLSIVTIGTEFFGDSKLPFPKLESLVIEKMDHWEEWWGLENGTLPVLREMHLKKCPKLRSLPLCLQFSSALTKLVVEAADSIRVIEDLVSVTELRLKDCPNLERISYLTSLKNLEIIKCPLVENVEDVEALQHLVLVDFASELLPEWLAPHKLMNLRTLDITGNRDLLRSLQADDGPEWHKIANIPHVYTHSVEKFI